MDYFNAFWVGGLICALVQILLDKTKLMPGRVMVLLVCPGAISRSCGHLPAADRFCRSRSFGASSWIRQYPLEGTEKSHRPGWLYRTFHRRLHCLRSRNFRRTYFFLSGQLGI